MAIKQYRVFTKNRIFDIVAHYAEFRENKLVFTGPTLDNIRHEFRIGHLLGYGRKLPPLEEQSLEKALLTSNGDGFLLPLQYKVTNKKFLLPSGQKLIFECYNAPNLDEEESIFVAVLSTEVVGISSLQ